MDVMESYLNENFGGVKAKHSSHEVLQKWRQLCSVVKNPKRRFRFTANLSKRYEADAMRKTNQPFLSIVTWVKWGRSVYMNIQKLAQFQNVLPLIVYFSSACLTGNASFTVFLLLTLGALAKKPMAKQLSSFFILLYLVFVLEIQAAHGRHLKEADIVPPPPLANHFIHN